MENLKMVIWDRQKPRDLSLIGGKAYGLHEIKSLNIPVPTWATLTTEFFREVANQDKALSEMLSQESKDRIKQAGIIHDHIINLSLETKELELLSLLWDKISQAGTKALAVRSSAIEEDGEGFSFAGQMETILNVKSREKFIPAVLACWASMFGERVVHYRISNGLSPWSESIAVVAQQMLKPEISGVIFTANPVTGNSKQIVINSVWGLGEGLVSGKLDADTFLLDDQGEISNTQVAEKSHQVIGGPDGNLQNIELKPGRRLNPSLSRKQLKTLAALALKVQKAKSRPVDIEFAIIEGQIYFLQARVITGLKKITDITHDNFQVWDNSNIVESYSGVTTPLTFSFIRRAYYAVYWQFWETLGVDRETIFKNRSIIENMLGLIEGRVYYNLLNWYKLISLMPGFNYNKKFMEQMMGLSVVKDYDLGELASGNVRGRMASFGQLFIVGFKMVLAHFRLPGEIRRFHNHFNQIYSQYSRVDFNQLSPAEMMKIYRKLENELLWQWKAPILNDFEAMIFYGLLKSLTIKWGIDEKGGLQNDLLCGEGDIRSTDLIHQLLYLAKKIQKNIMINDFFLESFPEEILGKINNDPGWDEIKTDFNRYLEDYGNRFIEEMKLESIPLKDNPEFCLSVIKNYLRGKVPDPDRQKAHTRSVRTTAEAALHKKLKSDFLKLWIYRKILNQTRLAVKNRENQRFARAQIYNLIRGMMRAIGRNWQDKALLENSEDIFYLEIDEIWSFIEGTSTCTELKFLVKLRKSEFDKYRKTFPDDHIETRGEVYYQNPVSEKLSLEQSLFELQGLGCRPGIVENEVKVVLKPDKNLVLEGEIMVARQTDPGWTMLFPSVSGLIIEKGSMLSHSAIVAREMGIPCIVGVKNAARILKSGDRVRMDGSTGIVNILSSNSGEQDK